METIRVGVFLKERAFAHALAVCLARECRFMSLHVLAALPSEKDPEEWQTDMILSDEPFERFRTVQLVRHAEDEQLSSSPFRVYRYKESCHLARDLLFIWYQMTGSVIEYREDRQCRLLVFAAAGGGCGTTSAAISVCRMLQRIYESRCLYLNLCPVNDSRKYLYGSGRTSLLQLLYYLQSEREFPLEHFITCGNEMDYIDAPLINSCFDQIVPGLLHKLLQRIERLGQYDFFAVDVGCCLCRENRHLMEEAEAAVILMDGRKLTPGKYLEEISGEIERCLKNGKVITVENFAPDSWEEHGNGRLYISQISCGVQGEEFNLDEALEGNYGLEIASIAGKIMEEQDHEPAV